MNAVHCWDVMCGAGSLLPQWGLCFPNGMKLSELEDLNYFGILILIGVLTLILIWGRTPMRMVVGFSCLIACRNMGVNLKFHVSNTFLCLQAFGNVGGG